jgi:hypothetical protein
MTCAKRVLMNNYFFAFADMSSCAKKNEYMSASCFDALAQAGGNAVPRALLVRSRIGTSPGLLPLSIISGLR